MACINRFASNMMQALLSHQFANGEDMTHSKVSFHWAIRPVASKAEAIRRGKSGGKGKMKGVRDKNHLGVDSWKEAKQCW